VAKHTASLNVSIVGAGKVGTALAMLFRRKGVRVVSVISRHRASARRTAILAGCKRYSHRFTDVHPETHFLLLAVSDNELKHAAREIAGSASLKFSSLFVAHTSGALTSDELQPLSRLGSTVFSFHPMHSFPGKVSPLKQVRALAGVSYGVEGSPKAIRFARRIVRKIGGNLLRVPKEGKILYHLACVFASNYSIALIGVVDEMAKGFTHESLKKHFKKLTVSSIENAFQFSPAKALTGPLVRGDVQLIRAHLKKLTGERKDLQRLYKALGQVALRMAAQEHVISKRRILQLRKILAR